MHNFLFFIVGVVMFLLAVLSLRTQWTMRRYGVRTLGTVIGVKRESDEDGTMYRPLVQFVTNDGQQIIWKGTTATSFRRNISGRSMRIIYDPRNPRRVIRNHWTGYAVIVCLCLMGAIFMAVFFGIIPTTEAQDGAISSLSLLLR